MLVYLDLPQPFVLHHLVACFLHSCDIYVAVARQDIFHGDRSDFAVISVWHQLTVLMQVINSLIFTDAPIWKGGAVQADSEMQREVHSRSGAPVDRQDESRLGGLHS